MELQCLAVDALVRRRENLKQLDCCSRGVFGCRACFRCASSNHVPVAGSIGSPQVYFNREVLFSTVVA